MILLSLDTSGTACSVCLSEKERILGETSLHMARKHAVLLYQCVDQLLEACGVRLADVEGFAVTIGPGTFTGLRVGLSAAKGLAYALKRPLTGIPTLEALAHNARFASFPVVALLDARKKQVYAARFQALPDGDMRRIGPERLVPPEALFQECRETTLFVGDGALAYRGVLTKSLGDRAVLGPHAAHTVRASEVARLAWRRFSQGTPDDVFVLTPRYIRKSDAEAHADGSAAGRPVDNTLRTV